MNSSVHTQNPPLGIHQNLYYQTSPIATSYRRFFLINIPLLYLFCISSSSYKSTPSCIIAERNCLSSLPVVTTSTWQCSASSNNCKGGSDCVKGMSEMVYSYQRAATYSLMANWKQISGEVFENMLENLKTGEICKKPHRNFKTQVRDFYKLGIIVFI